MAMRARPLAARAAPRLHCRLLPARPAVGAACHRRGAPTALARDFAWTPTHNGFPRRTAAELYAEIRELTVRMGVM